MVSAGAPMNPRLASSKSRVSANGSRACQLRLAAAVVGVACSEVEALGAHLERDLISLWGYDDGA